MHQCKGSAAKCMQPKWGRKVITKEKEGLKEPLYI